LGNSQLQQVLGYVFGIVTRGLSSKAEPPSHLPGTAPSGELQVVTGGIPLSTRAMQGAKSADTVAKPRGPGRSPSRSIISRHFPYPAVPGGAAQSDANRSYARSPYPLAWRRPDALPGRGGAAGRLPSDLIGHSVRSPVSRARGTQDPAGPLEGHSSGSAQQAGETRPSPSAFWAFSDVML